MVSRIIRPATTVVPWNDMVKKNHFVELKNHKLHIFQLCTKENLNAPHAPAVLMMHGALSNGTFFYSKNGRGLAPFLANAGFNVFVADQLGRGLSSPSIRHNPTLATHGINDYITSSIPIFSATVEEISKQSRQAWFAHSWGGILMTSALVRSEEIQKRVSCQVHFGVKRDISQKYSLPYIWDIAIGWKVLCYQLARRKGYLDAESLKLGNDDETVQFIKDSTAWTMHGSKWVDPFDGYDYGKRARELIEAHKVPPTWHLAGVNDKVRGHPIDVQRWAEECGQTHKVTVLGKVNGNKEDYDHNSMVVSKSCNEDHFPAVASWLYAHP